MVAVDPPTLLDVKDVSAVGTLFFRAEATSVLDGDNEIWYQQYPSYETGQVADGRVVIDFWTDDKIVAVVSFSLLLFRFRHDTQCFFLCSLSVS